ncbi:MAG TPA: UDP-N-acetylglucosamine 2-epimerase (non-hydrolyzing), partial [Chromatiaceae bacterium]|nr:UDP-N-acetylglucosamine 2-epimerase (non-hydrolyzing) [Chromatiaceae bacterium]
GSHAVQTAQIMQRFEPVLDEKTPDAVLVVGDVNSTIACALVAVKKGVPVVHVEAGLRSGDRSMPEEINRILTDQLSEQLFITEKSARENLLREGVDARRIHFAGNVMIDTLKFNLSKAVPADQLLKEHLKHKRETAPIAYGLVTLHRPSNVDDPARLKALLELLRELANDLPLVFPVHPRTRLVIERSGLGELIRNGRLFSFPPVGYLEMLGLMKDARLVLTDSGGIQEETTALGVPCITLRENTERPVTVEEGTNTITGTDPQLIRKVFREIMDNGGKRGRIPELWDGCAAERIVAQLETWLAQRA